MRNIFRKLDVHSRAEATALALDPQESPSLGLPITSPHGRFTRSPVVTAHT